VSHAGVQPFRFVLRPVKQQFAEHPPARTARKSEKSDCQPPQQFAGINVNKLVLK
jgi:hypothetical protein